MNRLAEPLWASSWLWPHPAISWAACSNTLTEVVPTAITRRPAASGSVQDSGSLRGNLVILGVDLVLGGVFVLHGPEGVQAHVESDKGHLHPRGPDLVK